MICLTAVARRTAIRAVAAAALLAASAGACSPSSADRTSTGNTVATEAPQTTTTNPYAVPAVIDAAYINRVLAGLDAVVGDVLRTVIRTNSVPRDAYDRLRALYADPDFMQIKIDGYQRDIREGFRSYRSNPGNKVSTVSQILSARDTCIFVKVQRDYAAVGLNPVPELDIQWVGIKPLDLSRDPSHYNPTTWAYIYDGFPPDRSQPSDPCAS
jgi:hypothetical protein